MSGVNKLKLIEVQKANPKGKKTGKSDMTKLASAMGQTSKKK